MPECSTTHTRPRSSTHSSKKWFPEPSVPNCLAAFVTRSAASSVAGSVARPATRSALRATWSWPWPTPAGMARSMRPSSGSSESGSWCSGTSSSAAIMPQPMSTPTADGITAPLVGMTEPTVAPIPTWASGIRATWPCDDRQPGGLLGLADGLRRRSPIAQEISLSLMVVGTDPGRLFVPGRGRYGDRHGGQNAFSPDGGGAAGRRPGRPGRPCPCRWWRGGRSGPGRRRRGRWPGSAP